MLDDGGDMAASTLVTLQYAESKSDVIHYIRLAWKHCASSGPKELIYGWFLLMLV